MAKSKSRPSTQVTEKKSTNPIVEQYYGVRSEIRKVTWPTREEAQQLTIVITIGTVIFALFLFLLDILFESIIAGIVDYNLPWIIGGIVLMALIAAAIYTNNQET